MEKKRAAKDYKTFPEGLICAVIYHEYVVT